MIIKKKKNDNMVIVGTLEEVKIYDQNEITSEKWTIIQLILKPKRITNINDTTIYLESTNIGMRMSTSIT